jgi:hypothetical protein
MNNKICIIVCYWGAWPRYLPFFLLSAAENKQVDFLIFTDNEQPVPAYPNITFRKLSLNDFHDLSSQMLGFTVHFSDPYKVCDFKPIYGFLFRDYLKDYQYWGYCDPDMIFGDMQSCLNKHLKTSVDVLSSYSEFMAGPFSLYRNTGRVNELFRLSPGCQHLLQDQDYRSFDENGPREDSKGFNVSKMIYFLRFAARYIFHPPARPVTLAGLRYRFQCSYKNHTADPVYPADITEVVHTLSRRNKLTSVFVPLMVTEPALHRQNRQDWCFRWEDGKLTDQKTGKEIFAIHFQESKKSRDFAVPRNVTGKPFIITPRGISYE